MKMSLYPCFKNWLSFNNIYIYSDPHFSDLEMKQVRQNYISDEEQVKRINSVVGKKDIIIFLGDIGNTDFIKKIRGYKVLVMGNHDTGASNYKKTVERIIKFDSDMTEEDKKYRWTLVDPTPLGNIYERVITNNLFDEVYDGPIMINNKILLSHEPVDFPFMLNIHGHNHASQLKDGLHINVCAEHIDYTPISLLSLVKSGAFSKVKDIHRMTIDSAIKRKNAKNKK